MVLNSFNSPSNNGDKIDLIWSEEIHLYLSLILQVKASLNYLISAGFALEINTGLDMGLNTIETCQITYPTIWRNLTTQPVESKSTIEVWRASE